MASSTSNTDSASVIRHRLQKRRLRPAAIPASYVATHTAVTSAPASMISTHACDDRQPVEIADQLVVEAVEIDRLVVDVAGPSRQVAGSDDGSEQHDAGTDDHRQLQPIGPRRLGSIDDGRALCSADVTAHAECAAPMIPRRSVVRTPGDRRPRCRGWTV